MAKIKKCKNCGQEIDKKEKACPNCGSKQKSSIKWIIIALVVVCLIGIIASPSDSSGKNNPVSNNSSQNAAQPSNKVTVPDFSSISKEEIVAWGKEQGVIIDFSEEYSEEIPVGKVVKQSKKAKSEIEKNTKISVVLSLGKEPSVVVPDFSTMDKDQINKWAEDNGIKVTISSKYSDDIPDGGFISQDKAAGKEIKLKEKIAVVYSMGKEPSAEFVKAQKKAQSYSDVMHMSKEGIYQQLISSYGEGFDKDAAKWAVEHINADFNLNALKKAESYSDTMYMSKQGIYDQLVSSYGENFTKSEAQYAVDHLDADYNRNALMKAKSYESTMNMSKQKIYEQLVSKYGEQFTKEEAQYAIDHLDD